MILFYSDWGRYPTAIPDVKTTNKSFLDYCETLRQMGVKNYLWPLQLMQPKLQGVDPFSEDLTLEQQAMIRKECKFNLIYFLREIYRIDSSGMAKMFKANRGSMGIVWCFLLNITVMVEQPRQTGKSVTVDGIEIWLLNFRYVESEVTLFTQNIPLRVRTIERIKRAQKLLPKWLNPTVKDDADNSEILTCRLLGNKYKCFVGQDKEDRAKIVGRGDTIPYGHIDEAPFVANIQISLPVFLSAHIAAKENLTKSDIPHGIIITTTSGDTVTKPGVFMYMYRNAAFRWNEIILMNCENKDDVYKVVSINSNAGAEGDVRVSIVLSHRQLGYTDEWLRQAIAITGGTVAKINQDYFNIWDSGGVDSPIDKELLAVIEKSEMDYKYAEISSEGYALFWYIEKDEIDGYMENAQVILGSDTGNASGRDANALCLVDVSSLAVIAESNINEANLHTYGIWVARLLIRFPNITLIVENKSTGQYMMDAVALYLIAERIDPFKRIFNRVVDEHLTMKTAYDSIQAPVSKQTETLYRTYKQYFGFITSGSSRQFIYDTVLTASVKATSHLIKSKTLSTQLRSLVMVNNRVDHPKGGHDDAVIAWLLCNWLLRYGKNLQHYGLNVTKVMSLVSTSGASLSKEELDKQLKLNIVLNEIETLKERLENTLSLVEEGRLENHLHRKVKEANTLGDTGCNLDKILETIRAKRKVSVNTKTYNPTYNNQYLMF